jgi:hypothetical protein
MKTILLSIILLILIPAFVNAQYKINKTNYSYSNWPFEEGDPYNPTTCGVLSFFIPGVGQMVAKETGRGFAFLGGYIGCHALSVAGFVTMWT